MDAHENDVPPSHHPDDRAILRACAQLMNVGRVHLAQEHLENWVGRNPDDAEGHALLAWCLALKREEDDAVEEAREAVRLEPEWAYTHANLGSVHLAFGRFRKAEQAMRVALELAPSEADYHATLAEALLYQPFRGRAARRAAEAGLAIDPRNVVCARVRARTLAGVFLSRRGREAMEYALSLEPESAESHFVAGDMAFIAGDTAALRVHMRETLRLNPGNRQAEVMLGLFMEFSRKAAAFASQFAEWIPAMRWVVALWIAQTAAVLTFMDAEKGVLFIYTALWLVVIGGPMLWARLRHPHLIGEMREWVELRPPVRRNVRLVLGIWIGIFLTIPWMAVVWERWA